MSNNDEDSHAHRSFPSNTEGFADWTDTELYKLQEDISSKEDEYLLPSPVYIPLENPPAHVTEKIPDENVTAEESKTTLVNHKGISADVVEAINQEVTGRRSYARNQFKVAKEINERERKAAEAAASRQAKANREKEQKELDIASSKEIEEEEKKEAKKHVEETVNQATSNVEAKEAFTPRYLYKPRSFNIEEVYQEAEKPRSVNLGTVTGKRKPKAYEGFNPNRFISMATWTPQRRDLERVNELLTKNLKESSRQRLLRAQATLESVVKEQEEAINEGVARGVWNTGGGISGSISDVQKSLRNLSKQLNEQLSLDGSIGPNSIPKGVTGEEPFDPNAEYIVFDTETTGKREDDNIIEIGAVRYKGGKAQEEFHRYIKATRKIHPKALEVHTLTPEFLEEKGVDRAEALTDFMNFAKGYNLLAYNAPFDEGKLRGDLEKAGLVPDLKELKHGKVMDILEFARLTLDVEHLPDKNYKLDTLIKHYKLDTRNAHSAIEDAQIAGKVLSKLVEDWKLGSRSVEVPVPEVTHVLNVLDDTTGQAPIAEEMRRKLEQPSVFASLVIGAQSPQVQFAIKHILSDDYTKLQGIPNLDFKKIQASRFIFSNLIGERDFSNITATISPELKLPTGLRDIDPITRTDTYDVFRPRTSDFHIANRVLTEGLATSLKTGPGSRLQGDARTLEGSGLDLEDKQILAASKALGLARLKTNEYGEKIEGETQYEFVSKEQLHEKKIARVERDLDIIADKYIHPDTRAIPEFYEQKKEEVKRALVKWWTETQHKGMIQRDPEGKPIEVDGQVQYKSMLVPNPNELGVPGLIVTAAKKGFMGSPYTNLEYERALLENAETQKFFPDEMERMEPSGLKTFFPLKQYNFYDAVQEFEEFKKLVKRVRDPLLEELATIHDEREGRKKSIGLYKYDPEQVARSILYEEADFAGLRYDPISEHSDPEKRDTESKMFIRKMLQELTPEEIEEGYTKDTERYNKALEIALEYAKSLGVSGHHLPTKKELRIERAAEVLGQPESTIGYDYIEQLILEHGKYTNALDYVNLKTDKLRLDLTKVDQSQLTDLQKYQLETENLIRPEQGTKEWLEQRRGKVTASRAADLLNNKKKWRLTRDIAKEIHYLEDPFIPNDYTAEGNKQEPKVRRQFLRTVGKEFTYQEAFFEEDEDLPMLGVSPDGRLYDQEGKSRGLAEFKWLTSNSLKTAVETYTPQMQFQMLITGEEETHFFAMGRHTNEYVYQVVKANPEMQLKLLDEAMKVINKAYGFYEDEVMQMAFEDIKKSKRVELTEKIQGERTRLEREYTNDEIRSMLFSTDAYEFTREDLKNALFDEDKEYIVAMMEQQKLSSDEHISDKARKAFLEKQQRERDAERAKEIEEGDELTAKEKEDILSELDKKRAERREERKNIRKRKESAEKARDSLKEGQDLPSETIETLQADEARLEELDKEAATDMKKTEEMKAEEERLQRLKEINELEQKRTHELKQSSKALTSFSQSVKRASKGLGTIGDFVGGGTVAGLDIMRLAAEEGFESQNLRSISYSLLDQGISERAVETSIRAAGELKEKFSRYDTAGAEFSRIIKHMETVGEDTPGGTEAREAIQTFYDIGYEGLMSMESNELLQTVIGIGQGLEDPNARKIFYSAFQGMEQLTMLQEDFDVEGITTGEVDVPEPSLRSTRRGQVTAEKQAERLQEFGATSTGFLGGYLAEGGSKIGDFASGAADIGIMLGEGYLIQKYVKDKFKKLSTAIDSDDDATKKSKTRDAIKNRAKKVANLTGLNKQDLIGNFKGTPGMLKAGIGGIATSAILDSFIEDDGGKADTARDILDFAMTGATIGTFFGGPLGAAIGAGIGTIGGAGWELYEGLNRDNIDSSITNAITPSKEVELPSQQIKESDINLTVEVNVSPEMVQTSVTGQGRRIDAENSLDTDGTA